MRRAQSHDDEVGDGPRSEDHCGNYEERMPNEAKPYEYRCSAPSDPVPGAPRATLGVPRRSRGRESHRDDDEVLR